MIYSKDKIIIKPCVKAYLKNYISRHLDELVPFEVHPMPQFQIRFSIEQYRKLSPQTKAILKAFAVKDGWNNENEDRWRQWNARYKKDFFWIPVKAYLFNYTAKNGYTLHANCEYGYEGREESTRKYFIDANEFSAVILDNIGKMEKDPFNSGVKQKRRQN